MIIKVAPSPFDSYVNIIVDYNKDVNCTIRMTDAVGQSVLVKQILIKKGISQIKLDIDNSIHSGIYFISLSSEEFSVITKPVLHIE